MIVHSTLMLALLALALPTQAQTRVQADTSAATADSRIDPRRAHDILELQRLKGLYFFHTDHKNWEAWKTLFTRDARLLVDRENEQGKYTVVTSGIDNVVEYVKQALAVPPSAHQGFTPVFAFSSDTEASGIWGMTDTVFYSERKTLHGYGHYHEQYRKEDGVWKFASIHLTRLKVDIQTKE